MQIISSAAYINKNDEEIENPFWNGEKKYFTGKEKEEMELQAIFKEAASYVPRFATFGTTWAKAYDVEWLRKDVYKRQVISSGGSAFFNLWHSRKIVDWKQKKERLEYRKHLKPILMIFGTSVASSIYMTMDTTMLGAFRGDKATGVYTACLLYTSRCV